MARVTAAGTAAAAGWRFAQRGTGSERWLARQRRLPRRFEQRWRLARQRRVPRRLEQRWRLAWRDRRSLARRPGAGSRSGAPRPKTGSGYPRSGGTGRPRSDGASSRPSKPSRTPEVTIDVHDPDGVRLQKVLAAAGLGSRRACEDLISAGRVTVDGNKVLELGVRVDPLTAVIHVDGMRVQLDSSIVTIALNKPKGVVSTMHDPEGRPSIGQFVSDREERLFHVGRLDAETEGLILLTNDGDLANRLSHPSHGVTKIYLVQLEGRVHAARWARGCSRASSSRTARPSSTSSRSCRRPRRRAWSRSSCTRVATASCDGSSTRSATRSRSWSARRSARSAWVTSSRVARACCRRPRWAP